ncbi:F0F1 ATP synthase subunit B [Pseudochrobactrum sp. sp1633]|uniref:F0F1 ATP synthase subunit B n=1 Tax=Pseudochrobactrum sp. sp1633 TaxID=3036706 RepID=UPI0025A59074|nr:F0F1 ATP synthase subunit B [Pseudochrobactrum sp. sp1633]MDM8346496.1 F0F1 ATP synthase subunit B [Pseudochrobactrum sp. sp1633]HWD12712.1 F0F1 ATP synthase subunit B [Pseudochrobactrum sp.]
MDATFIALVGLIIFLALLAYLKVPGMIGRSLDERAANIAKELDEARTLREEAQALLAEYHRKRKEAEKEAGEIVAAAQREASSLLSEAKAKSEDYIVRRNKLAEQKIAQAESDAVNQVRASAVEIAVAAAGTLIANKMDAKTAGEMFKASLDQVKTNLN